MNHRKLYVVHKGTFKCWFSANETLAKNERDKIPNPHFPDYLDIKELEKLGLVEYLDLETEPHPREKDAAEEPEPAEAGAPESNGLDALAASRGERLGRRHGYGGRTHRAQAHAPTRAQAHQVRRERGGGRDRRALRVRARVHGHHGAQRRSRRRRCLAALPRTEPDAAWTQAMNIANELRGGSVSMDTLKEDIVQRHQETSSPAPPPTQSTPIVSIYPIDESPNDDAGPRSVTPARLRQDTPSTILGGMGRLTGGHDLFGNLPGGEFPMDDDEDEVGRARARRRG